MPKKLTYKEAARAQKARAESRFYQLNSMLGNKCMFYIVLGGRMTGKSYAGAEFLIKQKRELKDNCKNIWMRISETSVNMMKQNRCKSFIDPDLQRKYKLDLSSKGMYIKNHKEDWMTVMSLAEMSKTKGIGFYDKDFDGWYNIVFDEFQLEQGEKRTSFDILYNFIGLLENNLRTSKDKVRIFLFGNTLEEASSILKAFNFIPQSFGRFYLHKWNKYTKKRELYAVIDNLEPTEEYLKDRYGSAADLLGGDRLSNYTNELTKDVELVVKKRTHKPTAIIKFSKYHSSWYTVWDGNYIKPYNREQIDNDIAMIPHIPAKYNLEKIGWVNDMYFARAFNFNSLITQQYFVDEMTKIKKR
ncbi:MAG: phage DNA encapsidation protein [Bacteroidales bacterium]|nr:phage DNA encapsidation protein [Candidatus Scybalousia scybalohippi]